MENNELRLKLQIHSALRKMTRCTITEWVVEPVFRHRSSFGSKSFQCEKKEGPRFRHWVYIGCVRLAALGRPRCVAGFNSRTNVGN